MVWPGNLPAGGRPYVSNAGEFHGFGKLVWICTTEELSPYLS